LDAGHAPTVGIGQVVTSGGASLSMPAITGRVDEFGVRPGASQVIADLLDTDCRLVTAVVRKLELHIFASLGADLRRRRFCDRVGLDVGFEFWKRECKRAKDERSRDCERNSSHCFAPYCAPERGQDRNLSPRRLKISASRAFGWIDVIAEQRRSAFPSTTTGERRENMSQIL